MSALIGVDGYRKGWVAAVLTDDSITWRVGPIGSIEALIADADVVAIDMPIGLQANGWRQCDVEAKRELGRAGARVFMTPPRAVIELGLTVPNDHVQRVSRELTGQGVSRQALGLASRILDVDRMLPDDRLFEAHPELSFRELVGEVLATKKSDAGAAQRIAALSGWRDDAADACMQRPAGVPTDDALDALACLWTAERIARGAARKIPASSADQARIWT